MDKTFAKIRSAAFLVALVASLGVAGAQQQLAEVSDPEFDSIPSPELQGTKSKSFKPKDWLEVEAGITIPAANREQEATGFIDRVTVKWYVAIVEKASKKPVLLSADINHINVPVGEEWFSSVYLSPNTMKRLTGKDKGSKGDVKALAIEVLVDGVKVGQATVREKAGWWNSPSLARGDRFPLLNKYETPFRNFWWDRYAEIEESR